MCEGQGSSRQMTMRTTFELGRFWRRKYLSYIKGAAFLSGLDKNMELNKIRGGLYWTLYGLKVTGPEEKVMKFTKRLDEYIGE